MKNLLLICSILLINICLINSATVTWSYDFGAGGAETTRDWNDGTNWDTGSAPVDGDDVVMIIPQIDGYVINFDGSFNFNSFEVDAARVDLVGATGSQLVTGSMLWKAGKFTGSFAVNAGITCDYPQNFDGRVLSGANVILTVINDCDLSKCEIFLDDSSQFIVDTGVTITAETETMQFESDDLVNPGTFTNNGRVLITPLNPINGPSWWQDVSFINNGVIECITSATYGHCTELRNYQGSAQVSESSGTFIINSETVDYLTDSYDTWPPLLLSGSFVFKEGHNFSGPGVISLWGDTVSCSDRDDPSCVRIRTQTFESAFHFSQLNFEKDIIVVMDQDLTVNRCYWTGGSISGEGDLIIDEHLTIAHKGLGSPENDIHGTSIVIKDTLNFINGRIYGTDEAKIIIEEGATMNLQSATYIGDDRDMGVWDFTLENKGTLNLFFDDYGSSESGRVVIVNTGTIRFADLPAEYAKADARPHFYVADEGSIIFESTGTLELRIRDIPVGNPDIYEYADSFDFYEGSGCVYGGELKIEFVGVTPSAGDRFKIIAQRKVEEDGFMPCQNNFDTITAVGLGTGLKLGLVYDTPDENLSSRTYLEVIVCNESEVCGAANPNQITEAGTTTSATGTGASSTTSVTGTGVTGTDTEAVDSNSACSFQGVFAVALGFCLFLFF